MRPAVIASLLFFVSACTETYQNHGLHQFGDGGASQSFEATEPEPEVDAGASSSADAAGDAAPVETFVTDLGYEVVANGYGPAEKDTSNGEDAAGDGKKITIGGVAYDKGLGVHAASEIVVALSGAYARFVADVGVDDEIGEAGSVVFKVVADGETLFDSGVVTGADMAKAVDVDVTGRKELRLVVEDGGDGLAADHGDWAGARLRK